MAEMIWSVAGGTRPGIEGKDRGGRRGSENEIGNDDIFTLKAAQNGEGRPEFPNGIVYDLAGRCYRVQVFASILTEWMKMERETRFELATSTLARLHSTS
jgi:hypothetical protein